MPPKGAAAAAKAKAARAAKAKAYYAVRAAKAKAAKAVQRPRSAAGLQDSSQDFPGHLRASRALADWVGACRAAPQ